MSKLPASKFRGLAVASLAACLAVCAVAGCSSQTTEPAASSVGTGASSASQQAQGASGSGAAAGASFAIAKAEGGEVDFDASAVTTDPTFVNYETDGTTVQLLAIRDSGGALHVALNTCQSCSPSPQAYFVQEGAALVCQNCRNSFTAQDVGSAASGCNPAPLASLTIKGDAVSISAEELDAYAPAFKQWAGPTA